MTKPRLDQGPDYERGFIDGMQHQMQSSVDKAVNRLNRLAQRTWVGLTDEERTEIRNKVQVYTSMDNIQYGLAIQRATETVLKEKNT